ncbi:MAG TPA: hypothetical protein VGH23_13315 [Rhizomicrobium sp.]|jgi:hypothetical protein
MAVIQALPVSVSTSIATATACAQAAKLPEVRGDHAIADRTSSCDAGVTVSQHLACLAEILGETNIQIVARVR